MLTMRSLLSECLFLTVSYCMALFFFQGRVGRKGFPGKVGPEGVKVNKLKLIYHSFPFSRNTGRSIFHNNSMNDSGFVFAGRSRCPRKSWVHGRTSKNSWHCSFLCWMMVPQPLIQETLSIHPSKCWVFTFQGLVGFIGPVGEAGLAGEKVRPIKKEMKTNGLIYF